MQTIEQLKQQRETLLQLAYQVYAQIQEKERKQEKPKVKIELGDFAFYKDHAYFITKDFFKGNPVGVRFAYGDNSKNTFSWIELDYEETSFAKFTHSQSEIKIIPRQDCDLSALGL